MDNKILIIGSSFLILFLIMGLSAHSSSAATATTCTSITVNDVTDVAEFGRIVVNHKWKTITLDRNYTDPVVIAKTLSFNGSQPAHLRIKDVTSDSFKIKIEEWDYLDGKHVKELVGFIVMDKGLYTFNNTNKTIEVGSTIVNSKFSQVSLGCFQEIPVVLTQSQTINGNDPIVTRNRNIGITNFEVKVQEEEAKGRHLNETVGYIAAEPGLYGGVAKLEVGQTGNSVNHKWKTIVFSEQKAFRFPVFLADMQTTNGGNTANVRYQNLQSNSVEIKVQEEKSKDNEMRHVNETVGYFGLQTSLIDY